MADRRRKVVAASPRRAACGFHGRVRGTDREAIMDDAKNNSKSDAKAGRLSDLQRSILRLAYRNRVAEGRTGDEWKGADVYYVEVLVDHFKFPAPRADLRS